MTEQERNILAGMLLLRGVGLLEWSTVFLLLGHVVVCKDVMAGNISKLLNAPLRVRWRIFKRSLKNWFYSGSLIIFLCSLFAIIGMTSDMWLSRLPRAPYTWTITSVFMPIGIFLVYYALGYRIILYQKFKLFIQDQHD